MTLDLKKKNICREKKNICKFSHSSLVVLCMYLMEKKAHKTKQDGLILEEIKYSSG